ncbi:MAG TPA: biotin-independent malonate decarboxylase subunit gamma [Burkholderiales bacterium]|nr:biotin-independent malonate decarboxylase subunit gamma [Burkholderiales bacterium]
MSSGLFSASTPAARVAALLDAGSYREIAKETRGALTAGTGTVAGNPVAIAATDRDIAGGSLGVTESQALSALLRQCLQDRVPAILCLDSAGARLDEGLPALGAFRQLYRQFLDLRLAGISTLAVLGRDCFGGASMLAITCSRRVYSTASRLAMSGPAVIQALGGRQQLDAENAQAVIALMGGAARVRMQPTDRLCADRAGDFRQAALEWMAQHNAESPLDLQKQHNQLGTRLLERGMAPSPLSTVEPAAPQALLDVMPAGFQARTIDGVLIGRTTKNSPDSFFGLVNKEPVGALALWTLAGACLSAADSRPGEAVMLLLDAPGQAATLRDERIMLSQYVAHVALVLSQLRVHGHRVTLQVLGEAAGGIYVALAAPATRVVALPGANVQMLPPAAMARVIGRQNASAGVDDYLRAGVVDTII